MALTRWDIWSDGRARLTEVEGSQDSWIFKGKVVGVKGDFYIGKPGSDNRLAYEIKRGGYIVANPSISIKSYHLHISNYRPNSNQWFVSGKFVNPPYLNVMPETIETIMYSGISLLINIIGNKRKFSDYMYSKKIKNWYKYKYYNKESKRMANSHSFRNILTNVKIKLILAYYRLPLPKLLLMIISPIYYKRNIKR